MVLTVILPYLVSKINEYFQRNNWTDRSNLRKNAFDKLKYFITKLFSMMNGIFKMATLINFLMFFLSHKKRNVAERLLNIDMKIIDPNQRRQIDFTYINRLIVWNAIG